MKIERSKVKVDLFGQEIELKKPNLKEVKDYRDALANLGSNGDASPVIGAFLEKLGLPAESYLELEMEHVSELLDLLMSPKKK